MMIRRATDADWPAIWDMLRPVFRAGETYAVSRDIDEAAARAMWMDAPAATFVAQDGEILGTYYIKTNHQGGGAHVCNCGYVTADAARGRGVAGMMCEHSQDAARDLGYGAMQFNMVLASNAGAVRLWQKLGFDIVGTLPSAFDHPTLGTVDGHVMWKAL
ncbi:Ribosomal protein S18 acetylase RimI [Octadecabacter temperatus]|uniref:Acetyltransferase (GNAT) family protein n=1 Tax=Octadecabacter temperatus TaxID=1458307 RepID=A0A0K0Y3Y8_9RHOB|nr:GNAT family N-acetyltransferase [Octadecabacter temperatus]AKS45645.1 Acetyltransferase (GNAT) family protein [Octadecabacter temperatus]SIN97489.1 Ribosomal protein S18 acetylase RimI [Octadecabacter temperatus]